METKEKTDFISKISKGLEKAAIELEEFRLQAALGKAEARDLYEDLKKKFNYGINDLKNKLGNAKDDLNENGLKLKIAFESLQLQLALGKAETRDLFEEQHKAITKAINSLETELKNNKATGEYYFGLMHEIGKFKIKMEILRLRYELKKADVATELEERKKELQERVNSIKGNFLKNSGEKKVEHFRDELSKAYEHLKKAFS